MSKKFKLFTNEIVFRGHPDKVCDQISGALLKAFMEKDRKTRAGIEAVGGKGKIFITGEVTSKADVNVEAVVQRVLKDIGYDNQKYKIINNLGKQSPDIAMGVDDGGAGDQGMMFGYACDETEYYLPKAMVILQELAKQYDRLRARYPDIYYPDGKAQITGLYDKNNHLVKIKDFVVSYQNCEKYRLECDKTIRRIIRNLCNNVGVPNPENIYINPTGKFLIGGFDGDAGLTGRKIVVDAYQSFANVGGGCMNGKDPTKVDFSAAHKARQIAKRYLIKKKLKWCEVQLSYAIGMKEPLAIYINSNKGYIEPAPELYKECVPNEIIEDLHLRDANFEELAKYGHFID